MNLTIKPSNGNPPSYYSPADLRRMARAVAGKGNKVFATSVQIHEDSGAVVLIASYVQPDGVQSFATTRL